MYTMNDDYTLTKEAADQYGEFLYYGWKHEFIEDGKRIGRKQGIKETVLKMIKSMLKKEISLMI